MLQTLHSEIKGRKDKLDEVQKDAGTCVSSIKVDLIHPHEGPHPLYKF